MPIGMLLKFPAICHGKNRKLLKLRPPTECIATPLQPTKTTGVGLDSLLLPRLPLLFLNRGYGSGWSLTDQGCDPGISL